MSLDPEFKKAEIHEKKCGREIWIQNSEKYCGKILEFDKNSHFSMHYHMIKEETWYILVGKFILEYYDLEHAAKKSKELLVGDVIHIKPGVIHKLTSKSYGKIIEVSTQHFETDSYRIEKSMSN